MAHANCWACAVPMLHAGRNPNDVTRPDFLNGGAPFLHKADAGRNDERLTERMRVPSGACARLESDGCAAYPGRPAPFETVVDADGAGEILGWPCGGWLRDPAWVTTISVFASLAIAGTPMIPLERANAEAPRNSRRFTAKPQPSLWALRRAMSSLLKDLFCDSQRRNRTRPS